jgi:hypothetical protein
VKAIRDEPQLEKCVKKERRQEKNEEQASKASSERSDYCKQ